MKHEWKVGDTGKTRGGYDFRIVCVDAKGDYPIIALIDYGRPNESVILVKENGRLYKDDSDASADLMPPAPKMKKFKAYAYYHKLYGLKWEGEDSPEHAGDWYRVPSENKEIEVEQE